MMNIIELPEDCLAQILSLTSPKDVLRSSAVSKAFLSVSNSDTVWGTFLPSGCEDIVSRSSSLIPYDQFGSKKDLFIYLCRFPILLENNTESFALDKWSGKICYMLGARALSVIWGTNPQYWGWDSIPESRFPECAVLKDVCWLEIKGKIHTTLLSPSTTYGAYFVFNIRVESFSTGFGRTPVKVSIKELGEDGLPIDDHHILEMKPFYLKAPKNHKDLGVRRRQRSPSDPVVRRDGWMEIEMGRYRAGVNNYGQSVFLEMTLKEVENLHWKNGLVVHGIELRPLC